MEPYHKIQTIFKRDPATKFKTLLFGDYSIPEFEYLKDNTWVFTEKVDGTNIRVSFDSGKFGFRGKGENASIPQKLVAALEEQFLPMRDEFSAHFGDTPVCLYGEGYGAKIQKGGGNYREDQGFVMFDVNINDWWLQRKAVVELGIRLNTRTVPVIGTGTLDDMIKLVKSGITSMWGDFMAEGIVARPAVELFARNGDRIITKLKHRDFPVQH